MNANDQPDQSPSLVFGNGEWRVLAGIVVLIAALVGIATIVSRDAPSSRSNRPEALAVPTITSDQGCEQFARYWIEQSGVDVEPKTIEGLTNCRLSDAGEWFVPTGANDPRLTAASTLTVEEDAAMDSTRAEILAEISMLEARLSPAILRDLERIYNPHPQPIIGRINDTVTVSRARSRYTRVAQAFLLDPNHRTLAEYVGWLMQRRIGAYEALESACLGNPETRYLSIVCRGLEDSLSVRYPPWLWDLRSTVWLNEYLAYRARVEVVSESAATMASAVGSRYAKFGATRRVRYGVPV